MKNRLKYATFALLLFGAGAFSSAKAVTADQLLVVIQDFAEQVTDVLNQFRQALLDQDTRISETDARIAVIRGPVV